MSIGNPKEEFMNLCDELALSEAWDLLSKAARPVIGLTKVAATDGHSVGETHYGAIPDMPEDMEWPKVDGRSLTRETIIGYAKSA